MHVQIDIVSTGDSSAAWWSSIQTVLISASISVLIVAVFVGVLLTYHPSAVDTLTTLLSGSRRRLGLAFGPQIHQPRYAVEQSSWAERVLQALRDRRDAAAAETGSDTVATSQYVYIGDSTLPH